MFPLILFLCKSNVCKKTKSVISLGKDPVKLLSAKFIAITLSLYNFTPYQVFIGAERFHLFVQLVPLVAWYNFTKASRSKKETLANVEKENKKRENLLKEEALKQELKAKEKEAEKLKKQYLHEKTIK